MKYLQKYWLFYIIGLVILFTIAAELLFNHPEHNKPLIADNNSVIPDLKSLSNSEQDKLIKYGRDLIINTALYFGPKGSISHITNGINCGSCHMEAGTKLFGNNFLLVASTYPRFRERSGRIESVEFRINDCMQRSLCGKTIDSLSKEMIAMVAYIKWIGKNVNKDSKVQGAGADELPFLQRAADTSIGKALYSFNCKSCHGVNGQGILNNDSLTYRYPPLWGENSYAISAGIYRLTKMASYIKNNMPIGANHQHPQLTDEESWDIAAYVNSQYHPKKIFAFDWPVMSTKPVDYPFGPYSDGFTEYQHRYGPFNPIKKVKESIKK